MENPNEPEILDVLIVEDNPVIRESTELLLSDEGFSAVSCEDGRIALNGLLKGEWKPRVILLDLQMPEMSGKTFLSEYLASEKNPTSKILVFAASQKDKKMKGVDEWIQKPVRLSELVSILKRYLL